MATVPISGTNIRLMSGVPFSNDYKNTRWFETQVDQYNYFYNKTLIHSMVDANFQRIEGKHFIRVNKSIDELWGTNYLMFANTMYNAKWFYAFVTKLEYIQKNVTYVHFEIDVLQTWRFEFNIKPSFVVREHCQMYNADGSVTLNTIDEGLNYGTDYEVVDVKRYLPYDPVLFMVIVSKSVMHDDFNTLNEVIPDINPLPQPLTYYVHPFKLGTAYTEVTYIEIGGILTEIDSVQSILKALYSSQSAVNNVVSIYVTEHIGGNVDYDSVTDTITFDAGSFTDVTIADGESSVKTIYASSSFYEYKTKEIYADKWSDYNVVTESKLLMYPYTVLIMDDFKGNRQVIKSEYINDSKVVIRSQGSMGTSNKVSYHIDNYLVNVSESFSNVVALENGVINKSVNDIPIVNDYLSAFLQGNKNSLANQSASIMANGIIDTAGSAVGAIASAASGNIAGTATGGLGVAKGVANTVFGIQGIEAKLKDIGNTPPSLASMGGNTAFDYGNGVKGVYLIKKQIKQEYRNMLSDFFNMFGYKVNRVKVPNLHTRTKWNYVQTMAIDVQGYFNNEDLREIGQIFDGGITLWHIDDVGNYALVNEVI